MMDLVLFILFSFYFIFSFHFIFLILDLSKEYVVILYVMVTQVTKHDTCYRWSHMSQSHSYNHIIQRRI